MKEEELRKFAVCGHCHRKLGESRLPLFWVVTIERFGLDLKAMERQQGLGMMLGHGGLAQVMGPNEDLAIPMMDKVRVSICDPCSTENVMLAALVENVLNKDEV